MGLRLSARAGGPVRFALADLQSFHKFVGRIELREIRHRVAKSDSIILTL